MKKFLIICLALMSILFVSANNSQANFPTLDDKNTVLPEGTTATINEVKTVVNVKAGDDATVINNLITNQNSKQTNAGAKPTDELKEALKNNGYTLPSNAIIASDGFFELEVVDTSTGSVTGSGLKFTVNIKEIADNTDEVGIVHYSSTKGFEYVKATTFNKTTKNATFELEDTSPVAFVISYKQNASTGGGISNSGSSATKKPIVNTAVR